MGEEGQKGTVGRRGTSGGGGGRKGAGRMGLLEEGGQGGSEKPEIKRKKTHEPRGRE